MNNVVFVLSSGHDEGDSYIIGVYKNFDAAKNKMLTYTKRHKKEDFTQNSDNYVRIGGVYFSIEEFDVLDNADS